jgi:uncharacterized protein YndB with AHSA1/START domain
VALNTTTFVAQGATRTLVTLTSVYETKAIRDAAIKTGMADGMEVSYQRLDRLAPSWT